jgi:hypothetical protein
MERFWQNDWPAGGLSEKTVHHFLLFSYKI